MNLTLTRPLAFIDLETTGLNISTDRIVEISVLKLLPDGVKEVFTMVINPEIPIPKQASDIHGFKDEDVKDAPTFAKVGKNILQFIGNADLSGYNIVKFDLPLLVEEFLRVGIDFPIESRKVIDVQHIFHKMEKRDLAAAYKFYCNREIVNQHSAEADITATYEILLAQVDKYNNIGKNIDELYDFTGRQMETLVDLASRLVKDDKGIPVFNFGKYKGRSVFEIFEKDPSYYSWMMKGDFPLYTKKKLTELILKWKQEKA